MVSRRMMAAFTMVTALAVATPAFAQLNTQHLKGATGLKAGSQAPPGGYVIAPALYFYTADTVKNRDGDELPMIGTLDAALFGVGYLRVTTKKLLGGFYGFEVLFPLGANNRIQGTEIDANPGAGLTDSAFVPISLGWHFKRADATAGYTIYAPTGRYTDGADDNTGFGMGATRSPSARPPTLQRTSSITRPRSSALTSSPRRRTGRSRSATR